MCRKGRNLRRVISIVTIVFMLCSVILPVYGAELMDGTYHPQSDVSMTDLRTIQYGISTYHAEYTAEYNVVVGVANGVIDCSVVFKSDPTVVYSLMEKIPAEYASYDSKELFDIYIKQSS